MNSLQQKLSQVVDFEHLVALLSKELDWPIEETDFDELTFEYQPHEIGLRTEESHKIREIRQLRPLETNQPWGIFFVSFEGKRIPIGVMKRILGGLTKQARASSRQANQRIWNLHDLLFISAHGQSQERELSFLHFAEENGGKNKIILRELGWDKQDTQTKISYVANTLNQHLRWPQNGDWDQWRGAFSIRHGEVIKTTKALTKKLAELAQRIRTSVEEVLPYEKKDAPLTQIFNDFQKTIFHHLTPEEFADMYAQTICYGLLAARVSRESGALVADDAALMAPLTQPFLKDLMETFLAVGGRKSKIDFNELGVEEVVEFLAEANMQAVLMDFGKKNPNEDPVLHFYEHFLKDYDGLMRKNRGVYYTPLPVVRFIVRSVDEVLKAEFGLKDGLADTTTWGEMIKRNQDLTLPQEAKPDMPFVQILDPATGTGTFLIEVIDLIHKYMTDKWHEEGKSEKQISALWNEYVPKHLLPRLNGFELMMAPYAIAHIKLAMKLHETGYRPQEGGPRVRVFLTNSLEEALGSGKQIASALLTDSLAEEAKGANDIKTHTPITIVIGNPPYATHNENRNPTIKNGKPTFIGNLINDYYAVNGQPLNATNSKNIKADENKFIRYAEHHIAISGAGVLGYISSSGYLDGNTMRGMRWHLLQTFNRIQILNLHGSVKRGHKTLDGSKDENVFSIQQGVAIALMRLNKKQNIFFHQDIGGKREDKYKWLLSNTANNSQKKAIEPRHDKYMFVERSYAGLDEYPNHFKLLSEIFSFYKTSIETGKDDLFIKITEDDFKGLKTDFENLPSRELRKKHSIPDSSGWNFDRKHQNAFYEYKDILYRPFDFRKILYSNSLRRSAKDITDQMADGKNISMITSAQQSQNKIWSLIGMSTYPVECCVISDKTRERSLVFPLYLYEENMGKTRIRANLAPGFTQSLAEATGLVYDSFVEHEQNHLPMKGVGTRQAKISFPDPINRRGDLQTSFGPRDIFDYIYAVLHSPAYRKRYADFLKSDFPRIPLPASRKLFADLAPFGQELIALHLLDETHPQLKKPEIYFKGTGDNRVSWTGRQIKWDNGKMHINGSQWFEDVPEQTANFFIGGYQPAYKWLKDRAAKGGKTPRSGRVLTDDDTLHYRRMIVALTQTQSLMAAIDAAIAAHGGWPDAFEK